jgi:hypothetical protein
LRVRVGYVQRGSSGPCKLTAIGRAKSAAVRDGRTLLPEDGRELRLAAIEALLTAERAARRGLWAYPNFAPLQVENLVKLTAEQGRFALVEGKVLSVRESGATMYVNFGRRWTRDFTVTILKRQQRTFTAASVEPKQREGRRIRVRGWFERRSGPISMAEAP